MNASVHRFEIRAAHLEQRIVYCGQRSESCRELALRADGPKGRDKSLDAAAYWSEQAFNASHELAALAVYQ